MSETKQATGISQGVTEKASGWTEFAIDTGGQYPLKVATKIPEIIELGRAATHAGQLATWTYDEADGNPNPHKPGTFYKNRTLSRVEVGGTQSASDSPAAPKPPTLGADKDRLIVRQVAVKAAAELYGGKGMSAEVIQAATDFERWITLGILEDYPFE